jgi:hypothetical protein
MRAVSPWFTLMTRVDWDGRDSMTVPSRNTGCWQAEGAGARRRSVKTSNARTVAAEMKE